MIALEQARDAAPRHGSVREALGRAYYGAGRTSAAEDEFSQALHIDPSNDYAHFGLGLCLAREGQRTRALGHLRLAVVMRPEVDTYRHALDRVQRQRPDGPEAEGGGPEARGGNREVRKAAPDGQDRLDGRG